MANDKVTRASVEHLIFSCGNYKAGEKLVIVCDPTTRDIANLFIEVSQSKSLSNVKLVEIPMGKAHGEEPPKFASDEMLTANLIISLCYYSLAHSQARIEAGKKSARFLSMPCYSWDLLNDPAVTIDYRAQSQRVRKVSDQFTKASKVVVRSKNGTHVTISVEGRIGNYCPGFVEKAGDLGSPPDIEANVSPIEDGSNGQIVIDGSITCGELGLLSSPVILDVKEGRIIKFSSKNQKYVEILDQMFGPLDSKRRILAECGVGLNPEAKLTGSMLTDEGAYGCVHFGFGSNHTVGGKNKVDFHLDFVMRDATLEIENELIIENGQVKV